MRLAIATTAVTVAAVVAASLTAAPVSGADPVDADTVDGFHAVGASAADKARKLVATNHVGKLPGDIIPFNAAWERTRLVPSAGTPSENGTRLRSLVHGLPDGTAAAPWLIQLEPGTYTLPGTLRPPRFVHLVGAGRGATTIKGVGLTGVVDLEDGNVLRDLRVVSNDAEYAVGVSETTGWSLDRVDVDATETERALDLIAFNRTGRLRDVDVSVVSSDPVQVIAVFVQGGRLTLRNVDAVARATGSLADANALYLQFADAPVSVIGGSFTARAGPEAIGAVAANIHTDVAFRGTVLHATGGEHRTALHVSIDATVDVHGSVLEADRPVSADGTVRIATSQLAGGTNRVGLDGDLRCVFSYDESFSALTPGCSPPPT